MTTGERLRRRVDSQNSHIVWRPVRRTNGSPQRLQSGVAIVSLPIQLTSPPVFSRSLPRALFSICLTRSRVMLMYSPISSSVMPQGCLRTASFAASWLSHSRSAHGSGMCAGARPRRLGGIGGGGGCRTRSRGNEGETKPIGGDGRRTRSRGVAGGVGGGWRTLGRGEAIENGIIATGGGRRFWRPERAAIGVD